MSIEKITSKIVEDAQVAASEVLNQAKAEGEEILSKAREKAEKIKEAALKEGAEEKERLISRRKSVAEIDGRKVLLEEKQKLINQCFEKAVSEIANMDEEKYMEFIVAKVTESKAKGGELVLNEKDRAAIGEKLVAKLNDSLGGGFSLSEETKPLKGGFMLKNGSVYLNGAVESLIAEAKEDLVGKVAEELFK